MENINAIKKRIKSVNDITQMTAAMQLVSAAKMRRSRVMLDNSIPFFALAAKSMFDICNSGTDVSNPYYKIIPKKKGEAWKIAYFVISGNQGLAGSYNNNIVHAAEEHVQAKILENSAKNVMTEYKLYVFGSVAKDKLIRDGYIVDTEFSYNVSEPDFSDAKRVSAIVRDKFIHQECDLVYLVYTRVGKGGVMVPEVKRLLPVDLKSVSSLFEDDIINDNDGETAELACYPDSAQVFDFLVDTYINAIIYGAMVESYSSEQTSRLQAMDNATDNAREMMRKLQLESNRARQAKITNELTEIINGAEQANNI
ncbi:MAG: ATP synthase F1 subunit gamma [Clostridia bacterium]|nr:ATP synthase F1 subunit gamma [Clostridia bacterium]